VGTTVHLQSITRIILQGRRLQVFDISTNMGVARTAL
jgi:hypothetical protein